MRYYPCQLVPLGSTLAINHGEKAGAEVLSVVQTFQKVELITDKGAIVMRFDQCVYVNN